MKLIIISFVAAMRSGIFLFNGSWPAYVTAIWQMLLSEAIYTLYTYWERARVQWQARCFKQIEEVTIFDRGKNMSQHVIMSRA